MKPSRKWLRMAEVYRLFARDCDGVDFSDERAAEMFAYESRGVGDLGIGLFNQQPFNGYAVGKHWMDTTVAMWIEDIKAGLLFVRELYGDPAFSGFHWWLDRVLPNGGPKCEFSAWRG